MNRRIIFFTNLYSKISESQIGFREGYSTIANAFTLQALISKYRSKPRGKLYAAFVDFKAAFDSLHRTKLWSVLQKSGMKGKLFRSMPSIYKSVKACLRANCALSEYCNCYLGLRQGCMISPILFLLFINELSTVIQESGFRGVQLYSGLVEIFLLLFADEVVLIPDAIVGSQSQLN